MDELSSFLEALRVRQLGSTIDTHETIDDEYKYCLPEDELKKILKEEESLLYDTGICEYVAQCGHLRLLKWLHAKDVPWDNGCTAAAAETGNIPMMQWLLQEGCPFSDQAYTLAAEKGHFQMLIYLRNLPTDIGWESTILDRCAARGDIQMAEWALNQRCPWNGSFMCHAVRNGHLPFISRMIELGLPVLLSENPLVYTAPDDQTQPENCVSIRDLCLEAQHYGQIHILDWLQTRYGTE